MHKARRKNDKAGPTYLVNGRRLTVADLTPRTRAMLDRYA